MDLSQWISARAERAPEKCALRFDGHDISYGALARHVGQLAAALSASGVAAGDCVAYLGLNRPEALALLFACARLGALYMPLNWRLAGPEHRERLLDCPPKVFVAEGAFVPATAPQLASLPPMTTVAVGSAPAGWLGYEALLARGEEGAADAAGGTADSPLLLCHTSGSTGRPKGVVLTQAALACNAANSIALHDMTAADRILTNLPLFHVGGLNNQTTPALQAGATVVLHARFDPEATFAAIEQERITLTVLVPTQLALMIAMPRWASADLSSLRMISTGSTVVPEHLIRAVHERGVPLVQIYGSTETCPIAAYLRPEDARRKAGSTGRAAPHCELRVVDAEDHDVVQGARGEILVRGANVMSGYWRQPQATAEALAGGWFHSGDIGHFDDEGFLWVDGRAKDMIICGGENIAPAEIENVLLECPDVAEVAVVGRPDGNWGEVVVAVVAPKAGSPLTRERLMALLEGRIARYKHPRQMLFVDELPKTALGKVRKEDVRRLVAQAAG
jgi:fatty-acyl-CoA synthase